MIVSPEQAAELRERLLMETYQSGMTPWYASSIDVARDYAAAVRSRKPAMQVRRLSRGAR